MLLLGAIALVSLLAGVLLFKLLQPLPTEQQPSNINIELHSIPLTDLDGQQTLLKDWDRRNPGGQLLGALVCTLPPRNTQR